MRYALILCTEDSEMTVSVTKLLYPAIAEKFNTTPSRVSSDIRRAIEAIWSKENEEALRLYFGNTILRRKKKPTNAEFIANISDMMRLRLKVKCQNNQ